MYTFPKEENSVIEILSFRQIKGGVSFGVYYRPPEELYFLDHPPLP